MHSAAASQSTTYANPRIRFAANISKRSYSINKRIICLPCLIGVKSVRSTSKSEPNADHMEGQLRADIRHWTQLPF